VQFTVGISTAIVTVLLCITVIAIDIMTRNKQITTLSAVYFGLLMGFGLGSLFWAAMQPIVHEYLILARLPGAGNAGELASKNSSR